MNFVKRLQQLTDIKNIFLKDWYADICEGAKFVAICTFFYCSKIFEIITNVTALFGWSHQAAYEYYLFREEQL